MLCTAPACSTQHLTAPDKAGWMLNPGNKTGVGDITEEESGRLLPPGLRLKANHSQPLIIHLYDLTIYDVWSHVYIIPINSFCRSKQ